MEDFVKGEYYVMYEKPEDYEHICNSMGKIRLDGDPILPDRTVRRPFKHIDNCSLVTFSRDDPRLEEILQQIEKVTKVEKVPIVRTQD